MTKQIPKAVLIGILAAIVAIAVIVVVAVTAKPTIDLNRYLTVEAEGYDGFGRVRADIDWASLGKKYGKKLSLSNRALKEMGGLSSWTSPLEVLEECVDVDVKDGNNVSNGDKVSYTWDIEEELFTFFNMKFKYKDGQYTVSGLSQVETFDAFADLEVTFEGSAPNGTVKLEYKGSELTNGYFSCDKTGGLSNGDTVKVKIDSSNIESIAKKIGKTPKEAEKTYTVSGLDEYIGKYADLTEDLIKKMRSEAEDTIYAYAAQDYSETSSLSDLTYAGYIMCMAKSGERYYDDINRFYMIYSGTLANSEGKFSTTKVFFPVCFTNILKNGDGMNYKENEGIAGSSSLDGSWSSTKGYTNPLLCYMELVEKNRDTYTAECGDGFEAYSQRADIAKLADISDDYKKTLYDDAKARIEAYIAEYAEECPVTGLTLAGEYLLVAKAQGSDYEKNNRYIIVYSATVSHNENEFPPTTVYYPVEYDGIVKLPNEYMMTAAKGIQGNSDIADSSYDTDGYTDGAKMFSDLVTANRNNYTYDVSEGLKQFGS